MLTWSWVNKALVSIVQNQTEHLFIIYTPKIKQ